MKNLICYLRVLIAFICLFLSSSIYAQTRKGYITSNSSEAQCRQYFKDNIVLLDLIEGIYDCSIIPYYSGGNGLIGLREWGGQEQATTAIIKKQSSGEYICIIKYGDRLGIIPNPLIKNLGDTNAYRFTGNYVENYSHFGNSGTLQFSIADRFIYNTNNFTISFTGNDAFHMVKMEISFIKIFPTAQMYADAIKAEISKRQEQEEVTDWSGSGFALNNGYICTNYHVIDGAKSIEIHGVQGDFTTSYSAKVIASDKFNDLAILKVDDADFRGFGTIPYMVKTSMADVGEEIFVLGYPLTTTMGDEIKLTTGSTWTSRAVKGDADISFQVASVTGAVNETFMDKVSEIEATSNFDETASYEGGAYKLSPKKVTGALVMFSEDKQTIIILPSVEIYSSLVVADGDNPAYFNLNVKPVENADGSDIFILEKQEI